MDPTALSTRNESLPADYSAGLEKLSVEPGNCFVAPPWHWIEHANRSSSAPACLFRLTDEPALRALGLWQEETRA